MGTDRRDFASPFPHAGPTRGPTQCGSHKCGVAADTFAPMCFTPATTGRHWDGSPTTPGYRRTLRVAADSPSRLLRIAQVEADVVTAATESTGTSPATNNPWDSIQPNCRP